MRARIKFSKLGQIKYVGHLDMMRYFQRAFRRAGFDVKYSEGFSPHMILSFASPLGVGLESEGEYFDIEMNSIPDEEEALERLNAVMADGIRILRFKTLEEKSKNAMSVVSGADYELCYRDGKKKETDERIVTAVDGFFNDSKEIIITKKTKKSERTIDIRPLIYDLRYEKSTSSYLMRLSAGSVENLRPELVMETFYERSGFEYEAFLFRIIRKDIYMTGEDGRFVPLC